MKPKVWKWLIIAPFLVAGIALMIPGAIVFFIAVILAGIFFGTVEDEFHK